MLAEHQFFLEDKDNSTSFDYVIQELSCDYIISINLK